MINLTGYFLPRSSHEKTLAAELNMTNESQLYIVAWPLYLIWAGGRGCSTGRHPLPFQSVHNCKLILNSCLTSAGRFHHSVFITPAWLPLPTCLRSEDCRFHISCTYSSTRSLYACGTYVIKMKHLCRVVCDQVNHYHDHPLNVIWIHENIKMLLRVVPTHFNTYIDATYTCCIS